MKRILLLIIFIKISSLFAQIPMDNLQLWVRADSVELDVDKVTRLYDLSPNNYVILQSNSESQPIQIEAEFNGYPVIRFDGNDDYFDGGDILDIRSDSHTYFFVVKVNGDTGIILGKTNSAGGTDRLFVGQLTSTFFYLYHDDIRRRITTTNYPTSIFMLTKLLNDRSNGINSMFINTVLEGVEVISNYYDMDTDYNFLIGALNNSSGTVPPLAGYYLDGDIAEIIIYNENLTTQEINSVESYLSQKYLPLDLGADTIIENSLCDLPLIIDSTFTDILWSTGETNDTIYINQTGEYTVEAKDLFGRMRYDTIIVEFPNPNIPNSNICLGDSILYDSELIGSYSYLWSDLTTDATKYYKYEGDYWLRIEDDNLCFDTVFFSVEVDSFKNEIWLGNDTSLCSGNILQLINGEELCSSFLWTPGSSTEPFQIVSSTGWQKLEVENSNGCTAADSVYVTIVGTAPTPAYIVENLCFGDTTQFIDNSTPPADITSWKWIINENDTLYTQNAEWVFETTGSQQIELIVESFSGCSNSVEFEIEIKPIPEVSFTSLPLCAGVELEFNPDITLPDGTSIISYEWLVDETSVSSDETLNYIFSPTGEYTLELIVGIDNACFGSHIDTFDVIDDYPLPNEFSSIFPYDDYCIPDVEEITFEWNISDSALFYNFYLASDADFENILFSDDELTVTELTLDLPLGEEILYWKVNAFNPCMEYTSTETRSIHVFNPINLSNLSLWLVADSVDVVSGKVQSWDDLSGNENIIQQTNASYRPSVGTSLLNNPATIIFNGTNSYLDGGDILDQYYNSKSVFIVSKFNDENGYLIAKSQYGGSPARYALGVFSNGNLTSFVADDEGSHEAGSSQYPTLEYMIVESVKDNSAESLSLSVNTVLKGLVSVNGAYNMDSNFDFLIGAYNNTSGTTPPFNGLYLDGAISEIIIFDTVLNETNHENIYHYLRNKYAPPVNLGRDIRSPYKLCDTTISAAYKTWYTDYQWSTGETDSIIHVNSTGLYSVTVTDVFGFESSDEIWVTYPEVYELTDTSACIGETFIWDLGLSDDYSFEWYGDVGTDSYIDITLDGNYAAIITDSTGCQYKTDTIVFNFSDYEFSTEIGPNDTALCSGNRLLLVTNEDETVDWEWSTGETSSEIVLTTSGEYSVTTTNHLGCVARDTINVTINGVVPIPAFESLGQCAYNPINFTDLSTSSGGTINSWEWLINGDSFSNEQNPSLLETNPELQIDEQINCEITLVIETDDGCGDFLTQDITVYPLPSISFTPQLVCQFEDVEFISSSEVNGGSVILNQWVFEEVEQTGSSINYSFVDNGYKIVQLSSTTDQGCIDSAELEVYVKPAELPVFSTENTCIGDEVYFINETEYNPVTPVQSMEWDFGDESSTSSESSPTHIYDNAGFYDAILDIVYSNGCELQSTQQVEVYYKPEIELSGLDACLGTEFGPVANVSTASGSISDYHWQIGNPVIYESVLANPEMTFDQMGSYPFSLTVGSDVSCEETVVDTIYVRENPLAAFSASRTWGAIPLWVDFTNTSEGAETYYWQFDTINYSVEENPYFVFQDSGTYIVELRSINEYGCYDTETMTIKSVVPLMDIILYSLRTEVNDNYLTTSVYIINNGTLPVEELNLDLNLGNGQIYRETIEDFQSGQVMDYTFTFKAYLADGELPEVVCVEAVDPVYGIYSDIDLTNNIVCNTNVQNLMVFQPYPNPVSDQLICEFIAANAEDISITLVNSLGEIAYKNVISSHLGYKKHLIDVSSLSQGVYYLQISAGEEKVSFKVEVNR